MSETFYSILRLRSSHVSTERKVWLLIVSLLLGATIFVYTGDYAHAYFTRTWLLLIIVFLSLNFVVGVVTFLIVSAYRQRSHLEAGERDNFILGVDALGRTFVSVATLGSILPIFDIPFHQFLTSLSLVAVALVLIFKDNISNFLDGYRLMFSSDLLIGDYIKINDSSKGVIRDISFHHTKLRTDEGNILSIPNSHLVNGEVTNYSKMRLKRITVRFTVSTKALMPIQAFEEMLVNELTTKFPDIVEADKVFLRIMSLEPDKAECDLEISVDQYSFKVEKKVTKFVFKTVLEHSVASAE